jgi:hypothetical protein
MKIDKSLQVFFEELPHLEPLHYGFKLQASNEKGYCICSLAKCLSPWRRKHHIVDDYSVCGIRLFKVLVFFNIVAGRVMNIIQQLPFILQHYLIKELD